MNIIQPYDDPNLLAICKDFSAENLQKNFPVIRRLWHQDDVTNAATTITDRINGDVITVTPTITKDSGGFKLGTSQSMAVDIDLSAYAYCGILAMGLFTTGVGGEPGLYFGDDRTGTKQPSMAIELASSVSYTLFTGEDYIATAGFSGLTFPFTGVMGCMNDVANSDNASIAASYGLVEYELNAKSAGDSSGTPAAPDLATDANFKDYGSTDHRWTHIMLIAGDGDLYSDFAAAVRYMAANEGYLYPGWIAHK